MQKRYLDFEWDPDKRVANIEKHGIDFARARYIFNADYFLAPARAENGEERWSAVGNIGDKCITVIFTEREKGRVCRIISARRARAYERRAYENQTQTQAR